MHENSNKEIISDNINKWLGKLSDQEVKTLEYFCGERGLKYGYKRYFKLSSWDILKINILARPQLFVNRILFEIWQKSYTWHPKLQSNIYLFLLSIVKIN